MRRILLVLTVALVVAAMMALTAGAAFGQTEAANKFEACDHAQFGAHYSVPFCPPSIPPPPPPPTI